jgi:hypothetical protein
MNRFRYSILKLRFENVNGGWRSGLSKPVSDSTDRFYGQAGLMVRNDISKAGQSSAGYVILHASPDEEYALEWDSDGDGRIDKDNPCSGYTDWPHWLNLERQGNKFIGYYSTDATNWIKMGEAEAPGAEERLDAGMSAHGSPKCGRPLLADWTRGGKGTAPASRSSRSAACRGEGWTKRLCVKGLLGPAEQSLWSSPRHSDPS